MIFGQESDLDSDRAPKVVCPRHPHLRWRTAAETPQYTPIRISPVRTCLGHVGGYPGGGVRSVHTLPSAGDPAEKPRIGQEGWERRTRRKNVGRGGCGIVVIGGHFDGARICMRMVAGR